MRDYSTTGAIRCTLISWWRTGYNLRSTVTTLPIIVACVPSMGEYAGLCGISQTWPFSLRKVFTVASSSSRAATISPLTAEFCSRTTT